MQVTVWPREACQASTCRRACGKIHVYENEQAFGHPSYFGQTCSPLILDVNIISPRANQRNVGQNAHSYLWGRACMCLHSCSSPCTDQSRSGLPRNSAGSDTWAACGRSGNSCRRSNTGPSTDHWEELENDGVILMPVSSACVFVCVCALYAAARLLTDWRQCGSWQLHACAVVQRASIGAGADWPAGAQQTQPFTFLPVTGISHWRSQKERELRKQVPAAVLSLFFALFSTHSLAACSDGTKQYPWHGSSRLSGSQ